LSYNYLTREWLKFSFVAVSRVLSGTKYIEYVDEVEKKAKEEDDEDEKEEKEWR
jgi:hypothetical protein